MNTLNSKTLARHLGMSKRGPYVWEISISGDAYMCSRPCGPEVDRRWLQSSILQKITWFAIPEVHVSQIHQVILSSRKNIGSPWCLVSQHKYSTSGSARKQVPTFHSTGPTWVAMLNLGQPINNTHDFQALSAWHQAKRQAGCNTISLDQLLTKARLHSH